MEKQQYFKPECHLTIDTVTADRRRFVSLINGTQSNTIHYDLSEVQAFDSAGLALLIDARRLCHHRQITLVIAPLSKELCALATLYGLEAILLSKEGNGL